MSLSAMVWALKTAPVPDPISHLVLIGLADHAGDDGRGARPSVAKLAEYARCSERSVQNKLRALEELGLILRGDQRGVEHLAANRRPVVYDLDIFGVNMVRLKSSGVNENGFRGERGDTLGCTPVPAGVNVCADRTVLEPSLNRPVEPSLLNADDFADFWAVYPRKTAKVSALKAWKAALKVADASEIIAGARRYAADPNREAQFTAYPATWLNAGRWEDEALPSRAPSGPRDRQGEILAREMAAARAADAGRPALRSIGGGFDA
ncbi:replication initiation protein [Arthrobacter phage Abidatro]|uniref:Helix-turn-helix DNA binding domain protein n=1 Tax=Arthrobacter phage Abidatro TaxID=2015853 RepID=A0A222ZFR3_9CAUD|nr:replication initiation protein [Arthrobacter phage Abidatro]ASR83215.1 helix-turn-helix DNA binding domain protein [Arthrobacter phage Abidatro]